MRRAFGVAVTAARRTAPRALRTRAVTVLRPTSTVHWFSSAADEEARIRAADAKVVEAENAIKEGAPLPLKVSGMSGDFAAQLYRDSLDSNGFGANTEQLVALENAIDEVDTFVARVFNSSSFAPDECWEALNLLVGGANLKSFDALSEASKTIVEDEVNLAKYQAAQKTFSVNLGQDVLATLGRLADAGRLDLFSKVKAQYFKLVMAAGNGVSVRVVSAVPLSGAQSKKLEKLLPKYVEGGAHPIISYEVDPSVLGGIMLQVGNMIADTSSDAVLRQVTQNYQL